MRDFLHHLLLPRKANNYKAKLLHHLSLLVLIAILLISTIGIRYLEENHPAIFSFTANFTQDDLLLQTNAQRAAHNLPPLQLNAQLSQAAYQRGQDMLAKQYWAHNAPDGTSPKVYIKGAGYKYLYAGENLARGFSSAPDVVTAWMNSQGHRDNLLSPEYDEVGFAVVTGPLLGDATTLVVQEFGRKIANESPVSPVATSQTTPPRIASPVPTSVVREAKLQPSITPTPIMVRIITPTAPPLLVASVQNNPLIDSPAFSKYFTVGVVIVLISTLVLDSIVLERKKIAHVVSHNIDHIMFFSIILLILLVLGRGMLI